MIRIQGSLMKNDGEISVGGSRPVRADAQRNITALLEAAKAVFAESGVDAPVRDIAEKAGVGVGTLYRHFPQRSQLIAAVFRRELDACANAAGQLAAEQAPADALACWMQRFSAFVATKRGLATALHSGDPAYEELYGLFEKQVVPALTGLLDAAVASGEIRDELSPEELMNAAACLSAQASGDNPDYAQRMVKILVDGLRYGAVERP
jgi:AcrR family transcriptional regulator